MRLMRTAGMLLVLAALTTACSWPGIKPNGSSGAGTPPKPGARAPLVTFALYTGPLGFRLPEHRRQLAPGADAVIGLEPVDIDVQSSDLGEGSLRQAFTVEGAALAGEPQWSMQRGLSLRIGPGKAGDTVTVNIKPPAGAPAVLTLRRAATAAVTVDVRYDDEWRPVTVLNSHTAPGPTELRLNFSKPVRRQEVEGALAEAQPAPIRGLMQWQDDNTLIWQVADMPPRLDFLLGAAHDQDGLLLPGGIPSVRVGEAPSLVVMTVGKPDEQVLAPLPPDIVGASLSSDRNFVNLVVWSPGTNRWDWRTLDMNVELASNALRPGRAEGTQPRLNTGLENWRLNPQGTLVAGFRSPAQTGESAPGARDLVIRDMRGGREQLFPSFVTQAGGHGQSAFLAWAPDGASVFALTDRSASPGSAGIVALDIAAQQRTELSHKLPLAAAGSRLALSPDGRYLLAGNRLLDMRSGEHLALPGEPGLARGTWEPQGARLLYSAKEWDALLLVEAVSGALSSLGTGLIVDWTESGKLLLVRWPAAHTRYLPAGQ